MRVAMSHALVKKTSQMNACIQAGMSFFASNMLSCYIEIIAKNVEFYNFVDYDNIK